jgi:flagellar basal-body rod modification protein FlgD
MSLAGIATSLGSDMFASLSPSAYAHKAKAQDTSGTTGTGSTSSTSSTSSSSTSGTSISSTFLNLLVQELQNQDPTAPVDSTAMVGQMISLNQLDQLININQDLTPASSATSSTGSSTGSASVAAAHGLAASSSSSQHGAQAASSSLPADPMSAALANASDPSKALDLTSLSHIYGGK